MQSSLFERGEVGGPDYSAGRDELDRYYSPPWFVDLLLEELDLEPPALVLEPFAGRALSIAQRLADKGFFVDTADLDPGAPVKRLCDSLAEPWPHYEAVITNPPYTAAAAALGHFLPRCRIYAALLRLTFLEPCNDRGAALAAYPPHLVMVLPRFSFTRDGKSDSVPTAWFVWDHRQGARRKGGLMVVDKPRVEAAELAFKLGR